MIYIRLLFFLSILFLTYIYNIHIIIIKFRIYEVSIRHDLLFFKSLLYEEISHSPQNQRNL